MYTKPVYTNPDIQNSLLPNFNYINDRQHLLTPFNPIKTKFTVILAGS